MSTQLVSPHSEAKVQEIPLRMLLVDARYQRQIISAHVNTIAATFDKTLAATLVVSDRHDGTYAVLDGQHRLAAMRKLGHVTALCMVCSYLTPQEEAHVFNVLNRQRRMPTPWDSFKARLFMGEDKAILIQAIADESGIHLGGAWSKNGQSSVVTAHKAIENILDNYGSGALRQTFVFIVRTWKGDQQALNQSFLYGVTRFLTTYQNDIDMQEAVRKMGLVSPLKIARDAYAFASAGGSMHSGVPVARVLAHLYNYRKVSKGIDEDKVVRDSKLGK
jgi:hypothetical protein